MPDTIINHKRGRMAENVAKIATPASATAQDVAEKLNGLIQALIDSKQMRSE
jgi:hypothetical protein